MMKEQTLREHPRLYVAPAVVADLAGHLHSPALKQQADAILHDADWLVKLAPLREDEVEHGYQPITRAVDSYLQCLTAAWLLTRDTRYREAAMKQLAGLTAFNHISCEARFNSPAEATFFFCLSYGELAATVAFLYDVIKADLTPEEKATLFAFLDKHLMKEAFKCLEHAPWWANAAWSNWNGVCAGGMGIMALAFAGEYPGAETLIPFVEQSLDAYLKSYITNGGGCPEGTGYWNYGMVYAIRYLLSSENATGRKHPALRIKELGKSLHFPLDFHRLTFGDNDGWGPADFYFLLARRMKQTTAALNAAKYIHGNRDRRAQPLPSKRRGQYATGGGWLCAADAIPSLDELRQHEKSHKKSKVPVARVYEGMGWAALADDDAFPSLRMTIRGGMTAVAGHAMKDQLSFKCMVNGETMITEQADRPTVSFTRRGNDVFGRSAASKSGLFVDGLGSDLNAPEDTTAVVKGDGLLGIRVDGAGTFLPRWKNAFAGRLFLLVDNRYWLVIDRAAWPNPADQYGMEARFHTFAESKCGRDWVTLKRGKERLTMTFASLEPAVLQEAKGLPTYPDQQATIFRWMSAALRSDHLQVVALNPCSGKLKLSLRRDARDTFVVTVTEPDGKQREVRVSAKLKLVSTSRDS